MKNARKIGLIVDRQSSPTRCGTGFQAVKTRIKYPCHTICPALLGCVFALCGSLASAQQPSQSQPAEPQSHVEPAQKTAIIKLAHVHAEEVAQAVRALKYHVHVSAVDAGRLLVRGLEKEVQEIEQRVVPMIDVAGTTPAGAAVIEYVPLKHNPGNLAPLLETVAPSGRGNNYAIDPVNRMLVVRADKTAVEEVKRLVAAIDRPAAPLNLEFHFIRGRIRAGDAKSPSALPEGLAPVAKALTANGLTDLALIAPVIVNTRDGERFEATAKLQTSQSEMEPLTLRVQGSANLVGDANTAQVKVDASVTTQSSLGCTFQAQTTIAAKLGAFTILAAAPGTTPDGDAVAVALKITRGGE